MVHGFVQQSHGRLEIESEPGKGTQVHMIFPAADSGADLSPNPLKKIDEPYDDRADAADSKPSVLVVEDNEDVRELAESVLSSAGYAVRTAISGEQALDLVQGGVRVDLLFTDVIMPGGMNGLELVEKLRQQRPELPVLVTTGYMDELPARERGRGLDILAKPYRHEDLLERVRAALKAA
jgi:CheY-like chemotaxis protein